MNNIDSITKKDKKVFIVLSPDYPNVGDIAINIMQNQILSEIFPNRKIIEIPVSKSYYYQPKVKNIINDDDIITIIGGGNMGNVWIKCEEIRRDWVQNFPNNKIFSFPQSINFENTELGNKELEKTIHIYNQHPNFTIFSRDDYSYRIMKKIFRNDVYLIPDIVMYSTNEINFKNLERTQYSLCFRNDKEKSTSKNIIKQFSNLLETNNMPEIKVFDTVINGLKFDPTEKEKIFDEMLDNFRKSKLVITDRLHGMIFSLITKTPCIALDNLNHKVSSTYNTWLTDVPYIRFLESFNKKEVLEYINSFQKLDMSSINLNFSTHFEPLYKILKGD